MGILDQINSPEETQKPAAKAAGKREAFPSATIGNDPRISALQAELEQEKKNLSDPNPEISKRAPSNIDAISREIASITGQKMPAQPTQPPQQPQPAQQTQQTAPQPIGGILDQISQPEQLAEVGAPVGRSEQDMVGADNLGQPLYPREDKMLPPVEVTDTAGTMTDLGQTIAATIDNTVGGIIPFVTKQGSYLIGRTISELNNATGVGETKTPEQIEEDANRLASIFSQPVAKMFGIDPNDPAYKGEAVGRFFDYLNENTKESSQNIRLDLQRKGINIPQQDIEWMMNMILPKLAEKAGAPVGKVAEKVGQVVEPVVAPVVAPIAEKVNPIAERINPVTDSLGNKVDKFGNTVDKFGNVLVEKSASDALKEQFAARNAGTPAEQSLREQFAARGGAQGSVGAAGTDPVAAYHAELASASPEIQQRFANIEPNEQNLKALQTHTKFEKFGMIPTEGEALQDTALMSHEYNDRANDPAMMARLEERDPKLIQGFEKIKDTVAPDVHESNPINIASAALEKLKAQDVVRETEISNYYQALRDVNGGQFPMNGKAFADNAIQKLHHDLVFEATPPVLKKALEKFASGEKMTFENFERLRTITATEMRKGGTEAHAAGVIRDALEEMPLSGETAALKPLADKARAAVRARKKLLENNPAIKAAISDTRSPAEIDAGVVHPAANVFIDKYYGPKTSEVHLQRLKQELGENSPEHQGLNSAVIENLKRKSGIVNDKGVVSQAALNKQIHDIYGRNLEVMLGKEGANFVTDLGDVARMSEHAKGKHFVNTSNTEVVAEQNRVKEAAKTMGGLAVKSVAAAATGGAYPALEAGFKILKEGREAKKEAARVKAEQEAIEKRRAERLTGATGTTKISDFNKGK